jgi:hypothetical protein
VWPEAGILRQLRDTILGLLAGSYQAVCAECLATMLGRPVSMVMMTMLGLEGRVPSFRGVCSVCHRNARVIGRPEPGHT